MNRHVYCLICSYTQGVRIETLDIVEMTEKEIVLSESSKMFSGLKLSHYNQYRVQQTADNYVVWCLDQKNIPKMKAKFIEDISHDLNYHEIQVNELKKILKEAEKLPMDNFKVNSL